MVRRAVSCSSPLQELASFVRESLTSLIVENLGEKKKSPSFEGLRGALLGVGRDASQCRLQVFDKGADVLDR